MIPYTSSTAIAFIQAVTMFELCSFESRTLLTLTHFRELTTNPLLSSLEQHTHTALHTHSRSR
jgi:hypothetical protein